MTKGSSKKPRFDLGTIRMHVESIEPDKVMRHRMQAFCSSLKVTGAPYVQVVVTVGWPREQWPYHVGDEFDLTFGQAVPS